MWKFIGAINWFIYFEMGINCDILVDFILQLILLFNPLRKSGYYLYQMC